MDPPPRPPVGGEPKAIGGAQGGSAAPQSSVLEPRVPARLVASGSVWRWQPLTDQLSNPDIQMRMDELADV